MKKLLIIVSAFFCLITYSYATEKKINCLHPLPNDIILGQANAPITIIEYSSMSCPVCAYLHNDILPEIEENYVKTGKVKLIFRHYPMYPNDIKAASVTLCGGSDKYYIFIKALLKTQKNWAYESPSVAETLEHIARLGGISGTQIQKCFADKQLENQILESRQLAHNEAKINATPTIIINGKIYNDGISKKRLIKAIDSALKEV